jgi:hypothetical protein
VVGLYRTRYVAVCAAVAQRRLLQLVTKRLKPNFNGYKKKFNLLPSLVGSKDTGNGVFHYQINSLVHDI